MGSLIDFTWEFSEFLGGLFLILLLFIVCLGALFFMSYLIKQWYDFMKGNERRYYD